MCNLLLLHVFTETIATTVATTNIWKTAMLLYLKFTSGSMFKHIQHRAYNNTFRTTQKHYQN